MTVGIKLCTHGTSFEKKHVKQAYILGISGGVMSELSPNVGVSIGVYCVLPR